MNQHFNSSGQRFYNANEPNLTVKPTGGDAGPAVARKHTVYGIEVLTDTVLDSTCVFATGYDGDTASFGPTLLAGKTYLMRLSRAVIASGTGFLLLEQ